MVISVRLIASLPAGRVEEKEPQHLRRFRQNLLKSNFGASVPQGGAKSMD